MKLRWAAWILAMFIVGACDRPGSTSGTSPTAVAPSATPSATSGASVAAPVASADASGGGAIAVTFDAETPGAPSDSFEGVVGDWYIAERAGARGLKVDGSRWRNGEPSANLAEQAKRLYGERYAEFLDGVKAFAFFPLAVYKADVPPGDIRISVRFSVGPDGSYLGARANALEDNMLFFRVVKGKRTIIDTIRNVVTPSKTWHTLAVDLRGKQLVVELDGKKRFEKTLDAVPSGRVGLWSKADSQVVFDDFSVQRIEAPRP